MEEERETGLLLPLRRESRRLAFLDGVPGSMEGEVKVVAARNLRQRDEEAGALLWPTMTASVASITSHYLLGAPQASRASLMLLY